VNPATDTSAQTTALCLCSTHLQLLNIVEYLAEEGVHNAHLIVLESGAVDRGIIDFAEAHYHDRFIAITRVTRPSQRGMRSAPLHWLRARRGFLSALERAITAAGRIDIGVFGHGAEIYAGAAYRLAGRPPVVIVDDGTDTYRYLSDAAFQQRQRRRRQRNLKRLLFGSDLRFVDAAQFYTLVAPEHIAGGVNTRQNTYPQLRATLSARPVVQEQHIVGQHLVEIEAMSAQEYRAQIAALCAGFAGPSHYFPHPGETAENLSHIASIAGLRLQRIREPYELFFLRQQTQPCRLSSFSTTAFITLSSWLADPRIDFVYIDARPLLRREAIRERVQFAYDFSASNPHIRLQPPFPAGAPAAAGDGQSTVSSASADTTGSE